MAVTYTTAIKSSRMTVVLTAIDAGASFGYLEIGTTAMAAVLATLVFPDPSGSVANGVLTFDCTPAIEVTATGTGTAAAARIRDSDGNDCVTGLTVGTSGTNIVIDNTSINSGQTVRLTAASLTHG